MMDALIAAAKHRKRPRDIAIFLILRYTGMRRESVASLRVRHLDGEWGLRGVHVKGGKTRDIPVPSVVMKFLQTSSSAYSRRRSMPSRPTPHSSGHPGRERTGRAA